MIDNDYDDNLKTYTDKGYIRIPGTEDWVEVFDIDTGGYEWTAFKGFYSPSARRYFWKGDSGCSCNSWDEDLNNAQDFENGDRAALRNALRDYAAGEYVDDDFKARTPDALLKIADFKETHV